MNRTLHSPVFAWKQSILAILVIFLRLSHAFAQLSGTYTIDPSGSGPSNFTSFQMAVDTLNAYGVSGPVVFKVADGTYNEQLGIGSITGASASNTITFRSSSADSSKVKLTYASATSSTPNYTLSLYKSAYLVFRQITIERSGTASYGTAVRTESCKYITFESCVLNAAKNVSSSTYALYSYADTGIVLKGNLTRHGYDGIYSEGANAFSLSTGAIIENNIIDSAYSTGIYLTRQLAPVIRGNSILRPYGSNFGGIQLDYTDSTLEISRNHILAPACSYARGIYLSYCNGGTKRGLIYNNMIGMGGSVSAYGIYLNNCTNQNLYYNTLSIDYYPGSASNGVGLDIYSSMTKYKGFKFFNNLFQVNGNALDIYLNSTVDSSDYNNFYSTSIRYNGSTYSSLSSYSSASGHDKNSIKAFPNLTYDLHSKAVGMNNKGKPIPGLTTDFDGDTRSSSAPDIGADEYAPATTDAGISKYIGPQYTCAGTYDVQVRVKNYEGDTLDSVKVTYMVDGIVKASRFYKLGSLAAGKDTLLTVGSVYTSDTSHKSRYSPVFPIIIHWIAPHRTIR